ncbi:MAG: hypothetical protein RL338_787 [Chloroflexota bacterium]
MSPASAAATADALARLYDVDLLDDPGDLDLWLALAARTDRPVLELATGSGRIAVPLAAAGHEVAGVDRDAAMLARAAGRVAGAPPDVRRRLSLVEGDARSIRLPEAGRFGLAFIALNSLLQIGGRDDQAAAVATLAAHLAPDGLAAIDVWLPDADELVRYDGRLTLEYRREDPETGRLVTKSASARYDAATATVRLATIWDEGHQGEPPVRWTSETSLRLVTADELVRLAEAAGLEVELLAGGYDLEPFGPGTDRAILLARRPVRRPV